MLCLYTRQAPLIYASRDMADVFPVTSVQDAIKPQYFKSD